MLSAHRDSSSFVVAIESINYSAPKLEPTVWHGCRIRSTLIPTTTSAAPPTAATSAVTTTASAISDV